MIGQDRKAVPISGVNILFRLSLANWRKSPGFEMRICRKGPFRYHKDGFNETGVGPAASRRSHSSKEQAICAFEE